jgi:hypothetical protein
MKQNRRRRHLRPRPTRSQVNQQIEHVRSAIQLFQLEALLEAHKSEPAPGRLRFLDAAVGKMKDEVLSLEQF